VWPLVIRTGSCRLPCTACSTFTDVLKQEQLWMSCAPVAARRRNVNWNETFSSSAASVFTEISECSFFLSCIPWIIFSPNPYYSMRKVLIPKLTSHPSDLKFRSVECLPLIEKQWNCSCPFPSAEFCVQYQASPNGTHGFLPPNIFSHTSGTKLMASVQWLSKITTHPTPAIKVW
jgi:hypothetical protein